ncbi:MAG TPA: stage V sporulation protein S [Chloroflexia bacterium]|nr:stage V sporulation protein S [Chloroflexia bacterium]
MDTLDNPSLLKVEETPGTASQNGTHDDYHALDSDVQVVVHDDTEVLKVSAHSRPSAVAGAIAAVIRHQGRADVQAIGAGATNQAVKAVAIARDYLQPDGIDIVMVPGFIDVMIADEERTAIRLVIESRPPQPGRASDR